MPALGASIGARTPITLVYRERELMPPAVRALIDFIIEAGLPARECGERPAQRR